MANFARNFLETKIFQFHLRLDRKKPSKLWHQKIPIRTIPAQLKNTIKILTSPVDERHSNWQVESANNSEYFYQPLSHPGESSFFSAEFSENQASFDWNFSRIESKVFWEKHCIDFLWVLEDLWGSIALGLDWSGISMNHFVGWDFFPVGGLKLNSKSVAKWESCDQSKTILDGKLSEQL